ncbi:MAG TPA: NAD(P)/FAD-dependent oxidoreductase [Candidatus Angelobacter sp.]|nr:NAD(P)/FAD-dependent oxidoreductase [Candidatus Angelobacter sp.]
MTELFDVCVIGGGPAGASLALRLADLGRSVVVIEKQSFPRRHIGESVTGGVLPLLQVLGVEHRMEAAGFIDAPRSMVLWAGQLNSRETHGGYQVDRGTFDEILLSEARSAGALVKQPARVSCMSSKQYWTIDLQGGQSFCARFLAEAGGRNSILGGRKIACGAQTFALYAYWSGVDPSHGETLVEAGHSQWYWGTPLPDGTFNATVFVDRQHARKEDYFKLMAQSSLLSPRLRDGACEGVYACDATAFVSQEIVTPRSIRVGDAALTIDPLSSQGVQTAIGTAFHAAVVINTILDRPDNSTMAMDFYRRRITESAQFHSHAAATQYRKQWMISSTPFWQRRLATDNNKQPRVSSMLTNLNQRMHVSPQAAFVPVAIATEKYVIESDGVVVGREIFCRVGEHSVSQLLSQITETMAAREILQRWSQYIPAPSALHVLEWAWNRGLLEASS